MAGSNPVSLSILHRGFEAERTPTTGGKGGRSPPAVSGAGLERANRTFATGSRILYLSKFCSEDSKRGSRRPAWLLSWLRKSPCKKSSRSLACPKNENI